MFCIEKQKINAERNTGINLGPKGYKICHAEERTQKENQQEELSVDKDSFLLDSSNTRSPLHYTWNKTLSTAI